MDSNKISILIIGATGQLGSLITKHALKNPKLQTNILVRNPDKNKELCEEVEKAGGKVIKADVKDAESKDCTKGIHTVVSALLGDDETIVEGQKSILKDALQNGVKRFVPSTYTLNIEKVDFEEFFLLKGLKVFRDELEKTPIKGLHFWVGGYVEYWILNQREGLHYWETLDQKFDLTTYEDTAKFVVAALAKEDKIGDIRVAGNVVTMREFIDIYNKTVGTNLQPKKLGNLDDLKKKIEDLKAKGEWLPAGMLGFDLLVYDGRGKLDNLQNDEFPEVKTTSIEQFLLENPDQRIPTDK